MSFSAASPDDFDFDSALPGTDLPDTHDELYDRYVVKFGDTFNWYRVVKNNDQIQIDQALQLMQAALAGDREAVTNADLDLTEMTNEDLNADW